MESGKIGARHDGTVACPGERIHPEVALQMEERHALHVAGARELKRVERLSTSLEAFNVVKLRREVEGGPPIPERLIGCEIYVHGLYPLATRVSQAALRRWYKGFP